MLCVAARRLLEGNSLNTLDDEINKNDLWIKNTTWPPAPVTFSTPGQVLSWLPAGEVTQAVEVSRKTVKMSRFSTNCPPPSVSLSSSLPRAGERGTMIEGAQSEQSDGEHVTPMDFLVLI